MFGIGYLFFIRCSSKRPYAGKVLCPSLFYLKTFTIRFHGNRAVYIRSKDIATYFFITLNNFLLDRRRGRDQEDPKTPGTLGSESQTAT